MHETSSPSYEKIKKLLVLALHSTASEGEVTAAMEAAKRLAEKYSVDLEALISNGQLSEEDAYRIHQLNPKTSSPAKGWQRVIASGIARLYSVRSLNTSTGIGWIGTHCDTSIAKEVYDVVLAYGIVELSLYLGTNGKKTAKAVEDFLSGFAGRIQERCRAIAKNRTAPVQSPTSTSLVVIEEKKADAIRGFCSANGYTTLQIPTSNRNTPATQAGRTRAEGVPLSRGVGNATPRFLT